MKDMLKSTSIDAFLNKEDKEPEIKKGIWENPFYVTLILTSLFLIGAFLFYKFRDQTSFFKDTKTTPAYVADKVYVPRSYNEGEQFMIVFTDRLGETISVDNREIWGKANKGDSVILYFTNSGSSVNIKDIKKIKR